MTGRADARSILGRRSYRGLLPAGRARSGREWLRGTAGLDARRSCRPYAGDALPAAPTSYDGAAGAGRGDGRRRRRDRPVADARPRSSIRDGRRRGDADPRHLPGPPAAPRSALGGEVAPQPARPAVGLLDVGCEPTAPADDAARPRGLHRRRRGVQWNDDIVAELPAGRRGARADAGRRRCRRRGSGRPPGACSSTPRSTRRSFGTWAEPTERAPTSSTAASTRPPCVAAVDGRPGRARRTPGAPLAARFADAVPAVAAGA